MMSMMLKGGQEKETLQGGFFQQVVGICQGMILIFEPFSKLKTTFCKY